MKIKRFLCFCTAAALLACAVSGCSFYEKKSLSQLSGSSSSAGVQSSSSGSGYYYSYNNITDSSVRRLYDVIAEHIDGFEIENLCVEGVLSSSQILQAVSAYKEDHPEKFWLKSSVCSVDDGVNTYVDLEYTMDSEELTAAKEEFNSKLESVLSGAPGGGDALELEVYAHDYLVDNCVYDTETASDTSTEPNGTAYDAYGALVKGKAVCEGYSRAFSLLCRELGINCVAVSGTSSNSGHMWNCVSLGESWYNVDVTWDDPDSEEEDLGVFKYLFLNMSDEMFSDGHTAGELYQNLTDEQYDSYESNCNSFVPECSADDYYYYNMYGTELNSLDNSGAMSDAVALAASEGTGYLYLTIGPELDFDETYNSLLNSKLGEWIYQCNMEYGLSLETQTYVFAMEKYRLIAAQLQD